MGIETIYFQNGNDRYPYCLRLQLLSILKEIDIGIRTRVKTITNWWFLRINVLAFKIRIIVSSSWTNNTDFPIKFWGNTVIIIIIIEIENSTPRKWRWDTNIIRYDIVWWVYTRHKHHSQMYVIWRGQIREIYQAVAQVVPSNWLVVFPGIFSASQDALGDNLTSLRGVQVAELFRIAHKLR